MTPRLPNIGEQPYGPIFIDWLLAAHNSNGSLKRVGPVFNVQDDDFGAKGIGGVDETAQMQLAIEAARAAVSSGVAGATVVIPTTIDGYVASTLRYYANVAIVGTGPHGAHIIQKPGTADFLFKNNDPTVAADRVQIRDLFLNGFNNQAASLGGIDIQKAVGARIERVWVDGFKGSSIRFKGGGVGGDTMFGTVFGCRIENMVAGGNAIELQSSASSQPDGTKIIDSLASAAAGTTAFKIVGAASRGADACRLIAFDTMGVDTIIDSDGVTTRIRDCRFEVVSGGMTFSFHPTFGATSPGAIMSGNTYALPGTLTFTDSGTNPVKRWGEHFPGNLKSENGGTSTQTPGAVATVNIPHGLISTPRDFLVQPGDANARGAPSMYLTADATNVILNFSGNLTAATAYTWRWRAEV